MSRISIAFIFKVFLVLYVVFNMTTLKYSLGLTSISGFANALLYVLAACVICYGLASSKFSPLSGVSLVLVAFLCLTSLLNLFSNFTFTSLIQVIDFLLPWLALAMVLTNKDVILSNYKSYWDWFNSFLVIVCFVGLCEYIATFFLGYTMPIMKLDTGMGEYFVGYSTLLQKVEGLDIPYFRFQGPFTESGDLAMWASVLVVYNLFRYQYIYATVLLVAMLGAYSPSAFISLFIALLIYIQTRSALVMPIMFILTFFTIGIFMSDITLLYNNVIQMKLGSLSDRASANLDFIEKLPFLINAYPFGIPLVESTNEKIASGVGFSAYYGPIGSYMVGGLIAFLIYIVFALYYLFLSAYKLLSKASLIENELYLYYIMLFTYVVQRGSFFEYALSPLLFAPIFFQNFWKKPALNE